MKRSGFENYRLVYSHLWKTYGQSWYVRLSYLLRIITRLLKLIVLPVISSRIIAGIAASQYDEARIYVVIFVIFSLVLSVLNPLTDLIGYKAENPIYSKITGDYFFKLMMTDVRYFNDSFAGYITTAIRQYGDASLAIVRDIRRTYINTILSILLPVIVIMYVDVLVGLTVLVLTLVQAGYLLWASSIVTPYRKKSRERYKFTSGVLSDSISNIVAIKSASQEKIKSEQVRKLLVVESSIFVKRHIASARLVFPREIITSLFFGVTFWITVQRISLGIIYIAGAVLIVTYLGTILTALYNLSSNIDEHDDNIDKIIPALEIINRTNIVRDPESPKEFCKSKGSIRLDEISFSYKEETGNTLVLDKLSFDIPAGQKVGVVGLSGAGKSTLAKLLLRFDDVDSGSITVDDIDIRDVLQADLRRQIAYVPQEPLLFHSTIKENVLLSKPDANDNEVAAAIKSAHAAGFIEQLPDKLDSIVGERGVKLSGGQKQRIAIARAVLQNSPIIILDEATSALDSESEDIIKSSFKEILKGKTAVVVAHRLSTLSNMDRIIVIDKGEIVEDGTHEQLVARKGLYATLWKRQQMHLEEPYVGDTNEA